MICVDRPRTDVRPIGLDRGILPRFRVYDGPRAPRHKVRTVVCFLLHPS